MPNPSLTILSDDQLRSLRISPSQMERAIETAIAAKADGRLQAAPKSALVPGDGRYVMATLATSDDGYTVIKQVSVCPDNAGRGLPSINGAVLVLDARTGLPLALIDANWVTEMRTAALSAVAARRLADPQSRCVAFVGTGVQARAHLDAFAAMFPLRRVQMLGRGAENLRRLGAQATALGLDVTACETPQQVLRGADLVVSSVTMDFTIEPFLDARWLPDTAFAAITDACIPWIPAGMGAFQTIVVDDTAQERDSANPMVDPHRIWGDLTQLVAGIGADLAPGRRCFAFRGLALGDYAAAVLALRTARAAGIVPPGRP